MSALLALAACASNGQGGTAGDARDGQAAAEPAGALSDPTGFAGMSAPPPGETAVDTFTDPDDPTTPDPMDEAADAFVGDQSTSDTPDGDASSASSPSTNSNASASANDASAPASSTPTTPPPPEFTSLADLEPASDNIPECPETAPEDPWGPCVGVPVYAVCNYGTEPAPYYSCICDWIHWICVGVQ